MKPNVSIELKTSAYKQFWLKYVWGFLPKNHGAKCLVGEVSRLILKSAGKPAYPAALKFEGEVTEYKAPFLYLCGYSRNGMKDNLHLAMEFEDLEPIDGIDPVPNRIEFEDANVRFVGVGLRRLEIVPPNDIDALPELFKLCKNWQFGWTMFPSARIPLREIGERPFEEVVESHKPSQPDPEPPAPDPVDVGIQGPTETEVIV